MLCIKYEPKKLSDIVGQDEVISFLRNAVEISENNNFFIYGTYGIGKTSLVKSFANEYEFDLYIYNFFQYDSFRYITNLIENKLAFSNKKAVILIDEFQDIPKSAQAVLLKYLEKKYQHIYIFLIATDKNSVLDTIISRCLYVEMRKIKSSDIKKHLKMIAEKEGIKIDDKIIDIIVAKSSGHLRDAINYLESYSYNNKLFDTLDIDFFVVDKEELSSYDYVELLYLFSNYIHNYVRNSIDKEFDKVKDIIFTYYRLKNFVSSFDDFITMLNVIKKIKDGGVDV